MFSVSAKSKGSADAVTLIRPSELPIYEEKLPENECEYQLPAVGTLQETVGDVRRGVSGFLAQFKGTYDYLRHVYETGKAHTSTASAQLQDETNVAPRAAAITLGGLTGLLLAAMRRRGLARRLLYTGVGLAIPSSVCYPEQTKAYARWGYGESKKYSVIAYNFLVGAKPGDDASLAAKVAEEPAEAVATPPAEPEVSCEPLSADVATTTSEPESAPSKQEPVPSDPHPLPGKEVPRVQDDPGQSNPEDRDLYTERA